MPLFLHLLPDASDSSGDSLPDLPIQDELESAPTDSEGEASAESSEPPPADSASAPEPAGDLDAETQMAADLALLEAKFPQLSPVIQKAIDELGKEPEAPAAAPVQAAPTATPVQQATDLLGLPIVPDALAEANFIISVQELANQREATYAQGLGELQAIQEFDAQIAAEVKAAQEEGRQVSPLAYSLQQQRNARVAQYEQTRQKVATFDGKGKIIEQVARDTQAVPALRPYREDLALLREHNLITPGMRIEQQVQVLHQFLLQTGRVKPGAVKNPAGQSPAQVRAAQLKNLKLNHAGSGRQSGVAGAGHTKSQSLASTPFPDPDIEERMLRLGGAKR